MRDKDWERPADYAPPYSKEDKELLCQQICCFGIESILEFGPGESTAFMATIAITKQSASGDPGEKQFLQITTCEHFDKWYLVNKKRFADTPNVRVLKYRNEMPVVVEGLGSYERFDLGFVDSPQGYRNVREIFPGYEDCSRFNTTLFALQRCRVVMLHDATRPLERATLGRLHAMGYEYNLLDTNTAIIINGDKIRFDISGAEKPGGPPAGADSISGGIPVNIGPDRLDDSGARKKRCSLHKGRRQSGRGVRSASGQHSGVESGSRVRRCKRSDASSPGNASGTVPEKDGVAPPN